MQPRWHVSPPMAWTFVRSVTSSTPGAHIIYNFNKYEWPPDPSLIYPRQVQLRTKGDSDRATCLLTCRDKWPENFQLGLTLALRNSKPALAKLDFFQSGKESKGSSGPFVVSKERGREEVVVFIYHPRLDTHCAIYPEHLDTGKLPIKPAPQEIILGGHHGKAKYDTEFLHGGKLRRERVAQSCYRLWGPTRNST